MMKSNRIWIDIVVFGTAIACALAVLFVIVGTAAGSGTSQDFPNEVRTAAPQQSYEGMVTCSRCGAKHSAAMARNATNCTRVCVHAGAAFALVNADTTYLLRGDIDQVKQMAGQRARVTGKLSGNTINVSSVSPES
jgi:hypothetical protein